MKKKPNEDLRQAAKDANVYLWQIASELGVSENTLYYRLRKPFTDEEAQEFRNAVQRIRESEEAQMRKWRF